jgi:hypothetical protein
VGPIGQATPSQSVAVNACASAPTSTPLAATPAADWPPGGAVPDFLAGKWAHEDLCLSLTGYTYAFSTSRGNVVINGPEIDFFNDESCQKHLPDGVGRWKWSGEGSMLTLSLLAADPCGRQLARTYTKT